MTLEHWYFVAEIVAAAAVVLSLCFLAFELRRNSNHVKRQSMDLLTIHRVEALKAFYEDEELASVIWKCFANESRLPAHEWARFGLFLYSFFWCLSWLLESSTGMSSIRQPGNPGRMAWCGGCDSLA